MKTVDELAIQGWIDTKTGEDGTFDKDGKPRPWTRWERLELWWNGLKTCRAEEKKCRNDWYYHGPADRYRIDRPETTWTVHIYHNPLLKQAYMLDRGYKRPIEWQALQQGEIALLPS